ncbi:PepSY domain-containing protein [Methylosinus sp. H3A]|nr:PepSY domain-containing protein [Methylosinus sp. H3A]
MLSLNFGANRPVAWADHDLGLLGGEYDPERRSASRRIHNRDSASRQQNQFLHDRQTEPGSRRYFFLAPEWLEHHVSIRRRHTSSVIDNDPLAGNGDGFIAWQWPLHSGYVLGWTGRIAVFLLGLTWPLLFFTGVMRWLQKRSAHRIVATRRKGGG